MLVDKFNITDIKEYKNVYILGKKKSDIINDILYNIHSKYSIGHVYTTTDNPFYDFISPDLVRDTLDIIPYNDKNCFLIIDDLITTLPEMFRINITENTFFIFKLPILYQLTDNIDLLIIDKECEEREVDSLYKFLKKVGFTDISYYSIQTLLSTILKDSQCVVINLNTKNIYWYKYKNYPNFYIKDKEDDIDIIDKFLVFIDPLVTFFTF